MNPDEWQLGKEGFVERLVIANMDLIFQIDVATTIKVADVTKVKDMVINTLEKYL